MSNEEANCCKPTCCATETATPKDEVRTAVTKAYGAIATDSGACCGSSSQPDSAHLGYKKADLDLLPAGTDLGLGCGNPGAIADLQAGDRVLDLGCGSGMDVLLAANAVSSTGRVIGVDMTPQMLAKARENVVEAGVADRVDIRHGFIESLPLVDGEVDVVISNCVINLSPDKDAVFREAFRALAPGGRLAVSDILITEPLPKSVASNLAAWVGCLAGAPLADEYLASMKAAGFTEIKTTRRPAASLLQMAEASGAVPSLGLSQDERERLKGSVFSYQIQARKEANG